MKRLEWLSEKYQSIIDIDKFIDADPSKNKKYSQWLIETYINKGYRLEDLYKANEYLIHFEKFKHHLPVDQRDINNFKTLAELWIALKPLVDNSEEYKSRSTIRDEERQKAYDESIILSQDNETNIFIPLTEYAAKFHGRGTQWCTSADSNNMFLEYSLISPLIIFDVKGIGKYQFHYDYQENIVQFMDENDQEINMDSKSIIKQNHTVLKLIKNILPMYKTVSILNDFYLGLDSSATKKEIYDFYKYAIESNSYYIRNIPSDIFDEGILNAYINSKNLNPHINDFKNLIDKKKDFFTYDVFKKIIPKNAHIINLMPKEYITKEICELMFSNENINNIKNLSEKIPHEFLDKQMIDNISKKDVSLLFYIPYKFLSDDFYQNILKTAYENIDKTTVLSYFSLNENKKKKITLDKDNRKIYIHSGLYHEILCKNLDKGIFNYSDNYKKYLDYCLENKIKIKSDLYDKIINFDPNLITIVPPIYLTEEQCLNSVSHNHNNIYQVPNHFLSQKFMNKCIELGVYYKIFDEKFNIKSKIPKKEINIANLFIKNWSNKNVQQLFIDTFNVDIIQELNKKNKFVNFYQKINNM